MSFREDPQRLSKVNSNVFPGIAITSSREYAQHLRENSQRLSKNTSNAFPRIHVSIYGGILNELPEGARKGLKSIHDRYSKNERVTSSGKRFERQPDCSKHFQRYGTKIKRKYGDKEELRAGHMSFLLRNHQSLPFLLPKSFKTYC